MNSTMNRIATTLRRRTSKLGLALAVMTVGGAGVAAVASIPAKDGVIHGCYDSTGRLRVVDTDVGTRASKCEPPEKPIDWNQKGSPGPVGAQGPAGPAFLPRAYVREFVEKNGDLATIQCDSGDIATGGGAATEQGVLVSGPLDAQGEAAKSGETAAGWVAKDRSTDPLSEDNYVHIWVVCLDVTPAKSPRNSG